MDTDRIVGSAKEYAGRAEGAIGDMAGDAKTQASGKAREAAGTVQNLYGQAKDAVRDATDTAASYAKDAVYQPGLRSFMEYRDLGIADATHGKMRAHIVRVKQGGDTHELHTTGLHRHEYDFQMFYVLKGTIKFVYEGVGERTFGPGDCVLQPAGIVHNELECTDDLEILEIYSPAVHPTVKVDTMPEPAAAAAR